MIEEIRIRAKNAKTNPNQPNETTWDGHCWAGAIRDREWLLAKCEAYESEVLAHLKRIEDLEASQSSGGVKHD
jgi:hypothetical protein